MNADQAERQMKLATQSANDQLNANKAMLDSKLDAGDRILLRKAADVSLLLAEVAAFGENPT